MPSERLIKRTFPSCSIIIHALSIGEICPNVRRAMIRKINPASIPLIFSFIVDDISLHNFSFLLIYWTLLLILHGHLWRCCRAVYSDDCRHVFGNAHKSCRYRRLRLTDDDGLTAVATLCRGGIQGNTSQQRQVIKLRSRFAAAWKNLNTFATVRTQKTIHILDDSENRHIYIAKHRPRFRGIETRDILRSSYQQGSIDPQFAAESGLRLTVSRRQIDN